MTGATKAAKTPPARARSLPAPALATKKTETVKSGESLSTIADKNNVRFVAMQAANKNLVILRPGDKVVIPADGPKLPRAKFPLTSTRDHQFKEAELWPAIMAAGKLYGVPSRVIAAIIMQESSMKNHALHSDGTGRGLVGLDPSGELRGFQLWSGIKAGKSNEPRMLPPIRQIEFLALRLSELREKHGSLRAAVAAWHTGGPMDEDYIRRIEKRLETLDHRGDTTIL